MTLSCFVFSTDEETSGVVRQALADLGATEEFCSEGFAAMEQLSRQTFQLVIVDWDDQPEAASLLTTTRQRKASERPLMLAIVRDDASVAKALQSGANSILRKPAILNHVKETLKTAGDLLRARQTAVKNAPTPASTEKPAAFAAAAGAASSASLIPSAPNAASVPANIHPASMHDDKERTWRAGEFLQSSPTSPGTQFETEADILHATLGASEEATAAALDPLKELEPVATVVQRKNPQKENPGKESLEMKASDSEESAQKPSTEEKPRGLDWYLKAKGVNRSSAQPTESAQPAPSAQAGPELIGYEQTASEIGGKPTSSYEAARRLARVRERESAGSSGYKSDNPAIEQPDIKKRPRRPRFSWRVRPGMVAALVVIGCAAAALPQAPWHARVQMLWNRGQQAMHAWLNPQAITPAQAPAAHESFARAGDEYKLPVAENIPDATTDPSQIRVVPAVDPTASKATDGQDSEQDSGSNAPDAAPGTQGSSIAVIQQGTPGQQAPSGQTSSGQASAGTGATNPAAPAASAPKDAASNAGTPQASAFRLPASPKPAPKNPQLQYVSTPTKVPMSLQSQLAPSGPAAGGDKSSDTALPSIEPVSVPEAAERALLAEQPALAAPGNGQQGSATVQVLVGRDGTVQDAKFLQGSLAFARAAVDGVRQWKFKPYILNGHPVSVQTVLTLKFGPAK
jgi:TonB family protein